MPDVREVFQMSTQKVRPDRGFVERQDDRQRRTARNRRIGGFGIAAVILVVGLGAWALARTEGGDRKTATNPALPTAVSPLTPEQLTGIWYEDPGTGIWPTPLMAHFGRDGTFELGEVARSTPWLTGTFEVEGGTIRFATAGGECGSTETFTWDASIVRDGRLEASHLGGDDADPSSLGECVVPVGEPYAFTRVSPSSAAAEAVTSRYAAPDGPLPTDTNAVDLQGYWLIAGTGQLLRLDWSGSYVLDGAGNLATDPADSGTIEIERGTVRFITGAGAHGCAEGDALVLRDVVVEDGALRATVVRDTCNRDLGTEIRLLFLVSDPG